MEELDPKRPARWERCEEKGLDFKDVDPCIMDLHRRVKELERLLASLGIPV